MTTKLTDNIEFRITLHVSSISIKTLQAILTNNFYDDECKSTALKDILKDAQLDVLDLYWD